MSLTEARQGSEGGFAEPRHGAGCLQRSLRSRFRQRLMPSVQPRHPRLGAGSLDRGCPRRDHFGGFFPCAFFAGGVSASACCPNIVGGCPGPAGRRSAGGGTRVVHSTPSACAPSSPSLSWRGPRSRPQPRPLDGQRQGDREEAPFFRCDLSPRTEGKEPQGSRRRTCRPIPRRCDLRA